MTARSEPLTKEIILKKALEIIDTDGMDALSMRRLGADLGVEAMTLYHHFPNKDAILDGVVDLVLRSVGRPERGDTWSESIRNGTTLFYRALKAHPNVTPLVARRPFNTPSSIAWMEGPLRILREAGFDDDTLIDAYHAITAYLFGWLTMATAEGIPVSPSARFRIEDANGDKFPVLRELRERVYDWSEGFDRGLDILLAGFDREQAGRASAAQDTNEQ